MKIQLFYQYYHNPDCPATGRHYQLLRTLGERHRIDVITSDVWVAGRLTDRFDWAPPGVTVHALQAPYRNEMGTRRRLVAYARYALGAYRTSRGLPRPDVVIGTSTPLSAAWAAARAARFHGVPWVFEVRDLWPDFPFQMGALRNPWLRRRLYDLEHDLYRSAAHVVPLSPDMEAHILGTGLPADRVTTLVNGTDLDLAAAWTEADVDTLRGQHGLDGRHVILYAGTFGRANAIPTLIEAARMLADRDDLCFVFLGEGYYTGALHEAARALPTLRLVPPEPRHRIFGWFRLAALSVVSFIDLPVLAANSPAKFFDSLACGTPVVVTNDGWTRRLVDEHRCGWYVPAEDPDALAAAVVRAIDAPEARREAGRRGVQVAAAQFDRRRIARTLEQILVALA